jgi:uncharacterized protein (TIGR03067 family)
MAPPRPDGYADGMTDDISSLQGRWQITSLEMKGAPLPGTLFANAQIIVDGDWFTSLGMGAEYGGRMTVDATAQPKRFSVKFDGDGPESGRTNHAIYELNGDDWRICVDVSGNGVPAEFKTTPGDTFAYETLARIR